MNYLLNNIYITACKDQRENAQIIDIYRPSGEGYNINQKPGIIYHV